MQVQQNYLETLKSIGDWVTITAWADRVAEDYPAMLEKAEKDARNQVTDTTGLKEIAARISSAVSNGAFVDLIDVDHSQTPKQVRYLADELRLGKTQFESVYQVLRRAFVDGFPGFNSFSTHEDYIAHERGYKDDLLEIYQQDIRPLMVSEDWEAAGAAVVELFSRRLPSINKPQNLVGWRYADYIRKLPKNVLPEFAREVGKLVDEDSPLQQRIDRFFAFFDQQPAELRPNPPATRSIASFYLTLENPGKFFFLKSREIKKICRRFNPKFNWDSKGIQATEIEYLNQLGRRLFERLRLEKWGPKDLIDVQSFLWAAETYSAELEDDDIERQTGYVAEGNESMENVKNLILYGPPGTGKTYYTVNRALEILDPEFYAANREDRALLKQRFDELKASEQIGFITFHQSFSYEDFVEGLRASTDDNGQITYEVEDGIFKRLCDAAAGGAGQNASTKQGRARPFQQGEMIQGNYVVEKISPEVLQVRKPNGSIIPFTWEMLDELAELIQSGKVNIEDIGSSEVFDNVETSLEKYIVNGYKNIVPDIVNRLIEAESQVPVSVPPSSGNRVLIIDEINRGNIANILGELITLIEPSKRAGAEEALEVTLPYSKTKFSVPPNLFLIGTMNTADRSLVHIDTALRRRFQFEVMLPDIEVLGALGIQEVAGIDVAKMLATINSRIELLYDKEHSLGHAFFIPLQSNSSLETLAQIFRNQIMPLLEEYFFEDWSRIQQVLGDDLKSSDKLKFYQPAFEPAEIEGLFQGENNQVLYDKAFRRNDKALLDAAAYRGIYEQPSIDE